MSTKLRTAALAASTVGQAFSQSPSLLYEQGQRAPDRERFPQVGRSVDIGGRTLNIGCSGSGYTAVILAPSAPWPFYDPKTIFENGSPARIQLGFDSAWHLETGAVCTQEIATAGLVGEFLQSLALRSRIST